MLEQRGKGRYRMDRRRRRALVPVALALTVLLGPAQVLGAVLGSQPLRTVPLKTQSTFISAEQMRITNVQSQAAATKLAALRAKVTDKNATGSSGGGKKAAVLTPGAVPDYY